MKQNEKLEEMELVISRCLKIGVLLSAFIIATGLIMYLVTGHSGYDGHTFPTTPVKILQGFVCFKSFAIILTGLLVLMVTPVLRVGVSIILFLKEKDYMYVIITSLVFLILICSFLLGKVE